jgi:hypothetical protein
MSYIILEYDFFEPVTDDKIKLLIDKLNNMTGRHRGMRRTH